MEDKSQGLTKILELMDSVNHQDWKQLTPADWEYINKRMEELKSKYNL